jgi:O-succinylbenzoic acid--CoA ligase
MTGRSWLEEAAARRPEGLALRAEGHDRTWGELAVAVRRGAAGLEAAGVRPGDRVALRLPPGHAFVEALHAAWAVGATVWPENLRLAGPEAKAQHARALPRVTIDEARAWRELCRGPGDGVVGAPVPSSEALLLFSSGTTGAPKAVRLTFANLEASASASARHLGASAGECWLACLPFFHVGGLSILVRSTLGASPVIVHSEFDAARVDEALEREGVTAISLVPTTLKRLLDLRGDRPAPAGLRLVLLGGAAAPDGLCRRAARLGWPVRATYGLTEAASQVATALTAAPGAPLIPLPETDLRIVDPRGRPCAQGSFGQILVRGPTVSPGYLDDRAAERSAFVGGWLHTADEGALDVEGGLRVRDRRCDLIVSGGENVSPAEVEAVLLDHAAVDEVAVAGAPDPEWGRRVVAWVVLREPGGADAGSLAEYARRRLAAYKVPREFCFVDALPRNAMGKVVRRALGTSPP